MVLSRKACASRHQTTLKGEPEPTAGNAAWSETSVWNRIQTLVARFKRADRIVLGVPLWNFAYPS
jgi:FMN-dependent NADH-azoreductase